MHYLISRRLKKKSESTRPRKKRMKARQSNPPSVSSSLSTWLCIVGSPTLFETKIACLRLYFPFYFLRCGSGAILASLRDLFDLIDEDESGKISPDELGQILKDLGEVISLIIQSIFAFNSHCMFFTTISTRRRLILQSARPRL